MLDIDSQIVEAVLEDWTTAPLDERLRAMLGYLNKMTLTPDAVGKEDIDALRDNGLSDAEIAEAVNVGFTFNVIDRLADAFNFEVPDKDIAANTGKLLHKVGYRLPSLIR